MELEPRLKHISHLGKHRQSAYPTSYILTARSYDCVPRYVSTGDPYRHNVNITLWSNDRLPSNHNGPNERYRLADSTKIVLSARRCRSSTLH